MFLIVEEWFDGSKGRPVGMPVKVLSLALPHMAVQYCAIEGLRGILDSRQARLTRVPLSYVTALLPWYGKVTKGSEVGLTSTYRRNDNA
jgi:hypothetical protein